MNNFEGKETTRAPITSVYPVEGDTDEANEGTDASSIKPVRQVIREKKTPLPEEKTTPSPLSRVYPLEEDTHDANEGTTAPIKPVPDESLENSREVEPDLTIPDDVIAYMKASESPSDWDIRSDKVAEENEGVHPSFWQSKIVFGGIYITKTVQWRDAGVL